MHVLQRKGVFIHYNSDFSGDALVILEASPRNIEVEIPCSVFLEFAAEYVRDKRIAKIEQMDADELLLGVAKQKGEETP